MKKWIEKLATCIASLALASATVSANSCCMYVMYQPRLPESVEKLKRH